MKQIVSDLSPKPVIPRVDLNSLDENKIDLSSFVYIYISSCSNYKKVYILTYEKEGYIFRDIKNKDVGGRFLGAYGWWSTVKKALERPSQYGEVFQCENYVEASTLFEQK
jgi:hypothetical protein